jgi:hypothetical protein
MDMNRRSLFRALFGSLAAPLVAKALPAPARLIGETRTFNANGTMSWTRDEIVPCITGTRVPIHITKFHEAEFVFTMEELSLAEFQERYPPRGGSRGKHHPGMRCFAVKFDPARLPL